MDKFKNILLINTKESDNYTSPKNAPKTFVPSRVRADHGNYIFSKLEEIWNSQTTDKSVVNYNTKDGIYMEFRSPAGASLALKSIESRRKGVRLLNVKNIQDDNNEDIELATVYIPKEARGFFLNKVSAYINDNTKFDKPKNQTMVNLIEDIKEAVIESFWFGELKDMPTGDEKQWCEIWLRNDSIDMEIYEDVQTLFENFCTENQIQYKNAYILFPERVVSLINVDYSQLRLFVNEFDALAEFRRAPIVSRDFTEMTPFEQSEWAKDLMDRTVIAEDIDSSICVFDTGVNNANPLLSSVCKDDDRHTYNNAWGKGDHEGHGTKMTGICTYFNLEELLASSDVFHVTHVQESVKILPPNGANKPELYGHITNRSFSIVEIEAPQRRRVYCLAVSSNIYNSYDGTPTSWSAEIDNLASGAHDSIRRLILLSSGNVTLSELNTDGYSKANLLHSIESPGQAWNAVTVGAYNTKNVIHDKRLAGYNPVASVGEMSPYNSTSFMWKSSWPIKPEIVCEGGNVAVMSNFHTDCDDLSLLTTNKDLPNIFDTINATSSATAQASYIAAKLYSNYKDYWPETVRGLLVHSANWTDKMKSNISNNPTKKEYELLLRSVGYGVPSLERALWTTNNAVNMVIQDQLQPFKKDDGYKTNEMHMHKVPWPKELLRSISDLDIQIKVRITLSYFIEPGPGEIGWKNKYRYSSCGLRFDMNNPGESKQEFATRINKAQRDDESVIFQNDSSRWMLGQNNRDKGSIHSDTWIGTPSDLVNSNYISVFPVIGWWRERNHLNKFDNKVKYSLIVSIESMDAEIDLYTPIITEIESVVPVQVSIEV
jgi:hypothetical protein